MPLSLASKRTKWCLQSDACLPPAAHSSGGEGGREQGGIRAVFTRHFSELVQLSLSVAVPKHVLAPPVSYVAFSIPKRVELDSIKENCQQIKGQVPSWYDAFIHCHEMSMRYWETPTHGMKFFPSVSYLGVKMQFYKLLVKSYSSACWLKPIRYAFRGAQL